MPSRQIAATDEAIDRLVYELSPAGMIYGLTKIALGGVPAAEDGGLSRSC
jgi:hypothetical protein